MGWDLPKLVKKGELPSATEWNKMVACLASLLPCASDDIEPTMGEDGTTWKLKRRRNAADRMHPFKIIGTPAGGFAIGYGVVNSVVPTLGGDPLDNSDPPAGSGTGDIWLSCELDGTGQVSAATVQVGTFPGNDPEEGGEANVLIGEFRVVNGLPVVNQAVIHSLQFQLVVVYGESGVSYQHLFGAV